MSEYVIAKYIRLSIEDEKTESMSILHQNLILDKHIDELDISNATVLEFVDNGHSGTNMERPGVQEMLELVRSGRVNCIAVKDFSRFSRNAMDSGCFIEQVFPLYGVRFISVADSFDSIDYKNDTGGLDIAFKFLIHEYYSADLSNKVKSAMRVKMRNGEYFCKRTIYGYERTDDKKLIINEPAASVVRRIFALALVGNTTAQIRDILAKERIPTPSQYIATQLDMNTWQSDTWTTRMVIKILKNEQYTGTYISGKQEQKSVGSHSAIWLDKEKWIVIPDSHQPIVSSEDFAAVQLIIKRYKNSTTAKPLNNLLQDDENRPHRSRMINGERLANNPIYGYAKGEKGETIIDQTAANIINEIYHMAAQHLSLKEIRDKLAEMKYPVPSEHIKLVKGYDIMPMCEWTVKCIRGLLQNVQYTGAFVSGKILKDYATGKKYHTAQSDWVIIPDKNPPIVSQELFDQVQETFASNRVKRKNMQSRDYLLRGGIVKCGCCGYGLAYDDTTKTAMYRCYHTLADPTAECNKLKIGATKIDDTVLTIIRKHAEVVLNSGELSKLSKVSTGAKQIVDYDKEIHQCVEQRQQAYERFVQGEIDREIYQALKNDCTAQIKKYNNQITIFRQAERDNQSEQKSNTIARHALSEAATPREIVETLIGKVLVFPDNRIEIRWKIADFMKFE